MNKKIGNLFKGDKGIWTVFFFLTLISLIEVFSASSTLSYKSHNFMGPIIYHAGTIVAGVLITIVTLNIPCRYFKIITPIFIIISYATLLWVLAFGESINGANRVIQLPGFTFQPSELAKGTMVLATAQILSAMQRENGQGADPKSMKFILYLVVPAVVLIGLENLSTAVLLFGIVFIMMFLGRVPLAQMGKLTGVLALFAGIFITLVLTVGGMDNSNDEAGQSGSETTTAVANNTPSEKKSESAVSKLFHRFGTWRSRLVDREPRPENPKEYNVRDNFQVAHANFAIASSGIIGKGPGNSTERDYLPQAFSDFIFSIIIEELGLLGAITVVFLYVILLFRAARIAGRCENNFPAFLVMGLALLLVAQAAINMMVAVDFGIVTGQPLPLVSKGGTSTLVNCAYIGAILSVSRSAKQRQTLATETAKRS
ncbi:MAG: FtsW/RodA/SpoVE family cell cycle protein [Prevotella sp.]|nr:FtsW/RodA/SpoVE family cell cycle protein [Prevotella sp.]